MSGQEAADRQELKIRRRQRSVAVRIGERRPASRPVLPLVRGPASVDEIDFHDSMRPRTIVARHWQTRGVVPAIMASHSRLARAYVAAVLVTLTAYASGAL